MKLYYSKGACSLAVRILLHELNLPFQTEAVDLKSKKTEKDTDYYSINPKGVVPTLELDNSEVLTENLAIQVYLAEINNAANLLPPIGDLKRYRIFEWFSFVSTDLHKGCGPLFNPQVPEDDKEKIFRPVLKTKLKHANAHLAKNKFLLGDTYTLPDGYLFVVLRWLPHLKVNVSELTHLSRFMEEMRKRDAVKKALAEEDLK